MCKHTLDKVSPQTPYIAVIGGQNIDISGRPYKPLVAQDSNPGTVRISAGGVARNIAHNLALLGEQVKFITVFGGDIYAEQLTGNCRDAGIDVSDALNVPQSATSIYLFIENNLGDMELAVSDMDIYKHITPEFLEEKLQVINKSALCVADTNLNRETLRYLAENCQCPLFIDAVSATKVKKLEGLLENIHSIKANHMEAAMLIGSQLGENCPLDKIADKFLQAGVRQLFLSLGANGLFCADSHDRFLIPSYPATIVSTTGAGDSLTAALAWAWRNGLSLRFAAIAGLAAASICISSPETVNPSLTKEKIFLFTGKIL